MNVWEQRKMHSVFKKIRNAFVGTATPYYVDYGYFYLQSNNVKNGQINRKTEVFINKEFYEKQKDKWLHTGDLVMVQSGHVGHTAVIPEELEGTAAHALIMFQDYKVQADSDFLNFQFQTNEAQRKLENIATGNTIKHILASEMKNFEVNLPHFDEQSQLATFFKTLDQNITLQQQELTILKQTKQGFLQKMFPKEGEAVPEVRFPGYSRAWEQKKIGDLANIVRGASPRPIQNPKWFDKESGIGWLRISDVTEQNGRIHYLEQHISKAGQEKTRVLTEPHLLLSIAATVGKPVVNYIKTGVHDGFLVFLNPKFEREFMFQWLEMFRPKWQKYGQPGSQVNLNSELVRNQEIFLPSIEEQKEIGEFFIKLDNIITISKQELEVLQQTKKAFLQKMFV